MKQKHEHQRCQATEEEVLLDIYYYKKGYESARTNDEKIEFKEKLETAEELYRQLDFNKKV